MRHGNRADKPDPFHDISDLKTINNQHALSKSRKYESK